MTIDSRHSLTNSVARLVPGTLIVATTLAGALPWSALAGASSPTTSTGVMLPLAVIHAAGVWRTGHTPAWIVFISGLLADALTAGPLGYWPLIYLMGLAAARFAATHLPTPGSFELWLTFIASATLLGGAAWIVSSLYQLQLIDWRALAWPLAMTILAFPLLAGLLRGLARWIEGDAPLRGAGGA